VHTTETLSYPRAASVAKNAGRYKSLSMENPQQLCFPHRWLRPVRLNTAPMPPPGWVVDDRIVEWLPAWAAEMLRYPGITVMPAGDVVSHFSWHCDDRYFLQSYARMMMSTSSIMVAGVSIGEAVLRLVNGDVGGGYLPDPQLVLPCCFPWHYPNGAPYGRQRP